MNAVESLRQVGAQTAVQLAARTGSDVESIYAELVHAESTGHVRVIVEYEPRGKASPRGNHVKRVRRCLWEAMEAV